MDFRDYLCLCLWVVTIVGGLFSCYYLVLAATGSNSTAQETAAASIGLLFVAAPFGLAYAVSAIVHMSSGDNEKH